MEETLTIDCLEQIKRILDNKVETDQKIITLLSKLGRLSSGTDAGVLKSLLKSKNSKVRALAVKNLAKLANKHLIPLFIDTVRHDPSSEVRREAVSAIGRMRDFNSIQCLMDLTDDYDPEVVLQALRGIAVFKHRSEIKEYLNNFVNHPNEMIKDFVVKELKTDYKRDKLFETSQSELLSNTVVQGDVNEILDIIPAQSIHLTFTSPPYYNARDYSIYKSYQEYLEFLKKIFSKVHRITKEGRFLAVNTSPIIIPRASRQHSSKRYPIPFDLHPLLIDIGWEFIDDIVWIKPEASVKNRAAGFNMHRKPLAYKPNPISEYVMVYRKKTEKLLDWNIRNYSWEKVQESKIEDGYETTNVWQIDPVFDKVHSAVFPIELCNRIIKYYSYVGDLVFDPFAGSGTLGKSALLLKRSFLLTEIQKSYIERIKSSLNQLDMVPSNVDIKFITSEELKLKMVI